MGDFYQNGWVTTLHNLRNRTTEDLERSLVKFSKNRPMTLVIPCLYSELEGTALPKIIDELQKVEYLNEIIIGLDRADKKQFEHAKKYFSRLPQHHRILWNDGPGMRKLDDLLIKKHIAPSQMGKGRNAWFCYGYFIAAERSEAIALHDADIVTYNRDMLARLFYPVVDPRFNYKFCKGFYYRESNGNIKGRVTRLLVFPLIHALEQFFGQVPFLRYLDGFRYPLAGEFSMRADVVKTIRIPSDWGLEVGLLSEVRRLNPINRICQAEIADRYDHKHQPLSQDDRQKGLSKMSIDISKTIFREMAEHGYTFSQETFRSLKVTYYKIALDYVEQYYNDAIMNGLNLDHHAEEETVELFAQNIYIAGEEFLSNPMQSDFIPSWKRVISAIPDFMEQFYETVENDNKS
mgnify:FL=1